MPFVNWFCTVLLLRLYLYGFAETQGPNWIQVRQISNQGTQKQWFYIRFYLVIGIAAKLRIISLWGKIAWRMNSLV